MQFLDEEAIAAPTYRLAAKNLFLTYPRCPLSAEFVRDALLVTLGRANVVYAVISVEEHKEENNEAETTRHVHAFVLLATKTNIRNANELDIAGYHGNYQGCRNAKQVIRYVKKDGNFIEYGECPANLMDMDDKKGLLGEIAKITNEQDLMSFLFLRGLSKEHQVLTKYWQNIRFGQEQSTAYTADQFHPPPELTASVFSPTRSSKALILVGPPGLGKTQWLLSTHPNSLRCTHMDDLKLLRPIHDTIILDDLEFGHLPRTSLLHLFDVQTARSIHCRHTNARLRSGLKMISVGNSLNLVLGTHSSDPAVLRRIEVFELNQSLF